MHFRKVPIESEYIEKFPKMHEIRTSKEKSCILHKNMLDKGIVYVVDCG